MGGEEVGGLVVLVVEYYALAGCGGDFGGVCGDYNVGGYSLVSGGMGVRGLLVVVDECMT